jgi:hypothetical protein
VRGSTIASATLLACSCVYGQVWQVDLAKWGYALPSHGGLETSHQKRDLDFDQDNHVLAAFVTAVPDKLATRNSSALTLHLLNFTPDGRLVSDTQYPTASRYNNQILSGVNGGVLVRTDDVLELVSADGKVLARREVPEDSRFYGSPDRTRLGYDQGFPSNSLVLLNTEDLSVVGECDYRPGVSSISVHNILTLLSGSGYQFEARDCSGAKSFVYSARLTGRHGGLMPPVNGTLLNDTAAVLSADSSPIIEVIDRGVPVWTEILDEHHERSSRPAMADKHGNRFALLVNTFVGGSKFFDISSRLKSQRVVVYDTKSGKRLIEVLVPRLPKYLLEFAISQDGTMLAIKCDGDLKVISIDQH